MPFVLRNVEAEEIHFIQEGEIAFHTEYGSITGTPGDFVHIPRSIAYRAVPARSPVVDFVIENPGPFKFDTPSPASRLHAHH